MESYTTDKGGGEENLFPLWHIISSCLDFLPCLKKYWPVCKQEAVGPGIAIKAVIFNEMFWGGKLQALLETYKLSFKTYNACLNFFWMFKQGISFEMVVLFVMLRVLGIGPIQ